jgi:hypothetical protein
MAWTQADIDRLKSAIATGAKISEFRSGDTSRKVELRSLDEMQRLLASMEQDVAAAAGIAARAPSYAQHSRD